MKIINATKHTLLAHEGHVAETFTARLKGLIHKSFFQKGQALVIPSCWCIHMFFMKFSIDAVFINSSGKVIGLVRGLKPFQVSCVFWKAQSVIEFPSGTIDVTGTEMGDVILMQDE